MITKFESYRKFIVNDNKFQLLSGDNIVSETYFTIEDPDEFFNEKYVTIYDLKTSEDFRGKGFAKYLLDQIFKYVENELKLNIITLIVDKDNYKAINLYFNVGFEIFMEYEEQGYEKSMSLIKRL